MCVQWEEYMRRRKEKEGVVKDLAGNVIEGTKPSYAVQVCILDTLPDISCAMNIRSMPIHECVLNDRAGWNRGTPQNWRPGEFG
jgi:hypothetical protein